MFGQVLEGQPLVGNLNLGVVLNQLVLGCLDCQVDNLEVLHLLGQSTEYLPISQVQPYDTQVTEGLNPRLQAKVEPGE